MSLEAFQLLDNEPIAIRIAEKDVLKVYHKQGAQLKQPDQNIEFIFGENINYHQIGNGYLESDMTVRKSDSIIFHYKDPMQLVNNPVAFCFKEARLSTTLRSDIETNKICGQVSSNMRVISDKDGDFSFQFDNINEIDIPIVDRLADIPPQIQSTPHQKMLINNHTDANKGKLKGFLNLEDIFGFCKSFQKVTRNLSFHFILKLADLQDIIYTSMADDINVTVKSFHLFIHNLIPSVEFE